MSSSVLLYNLFPVHHWKLLTKKLLEYCRHDDIYIHVSLPILKAVPWKKYRIKKYLSRFTDEKKVFFSINRKKKGESTGFLSFRKKIDFARYSIATYIHSKGVSKRKWRSKNVYDWTLLMKYFVIDRLDLCETAFANGYKLYGCLLRTKEQLESGNDSAFFNSNFHYSGNFVSVNLSELRQKFVSAPITPGFFGVESFWGTLCDSHSAFNVHESGIKNHYESPYPELLYKDCEFLLKKRPCRNG